MTTTVTLREVTPDEYVQLDTLAHARTTEARRVARAQILWAMLHGARPSAIATRFGLSRPTVYTWIRRFNAQGIAGLDDLPRSGRPTTYTPQETAEVIAAALTDPQTLGLGFGCWTLDRLQAYLNTQQGIAIKRSRIDELLRAKGLRWRTQEGWFGERVDPAFAEKRGASRRSTPPRRRAAS